LHYQDHWLAARHGSFAFYDACWVKVTTTLKYDTYILHIVAYLKVKKIKGHDYGYIVHGWRENGKVKQEEQYLGRLDPAPKENLKVAVREVRSHGDVFISISRELTGQLVLIEYKYRVLPDEFKDVVKDLISDRKKIHDK